RPAVGEPVGVDLDRLALQRRHGRDDELVGGLLLQRGQHGGDRRAGRRIENVGCVDHAAGQRRKSLGRCGRRDGERGEQSKEEDVNGSRYANGFSQLPDPPPPPKLPPPPEKLPPVVDTTEPHDQPEELDDPLPLPSMRLRKCHLACRRASQRRRSFDIRPSAMPAETMTGRQSRSQASETSDRIAPSRSMNRIDRKNPPTLNTLSTTKPSTWARNPGCACAARRFHWAESPPSTLMIVSVPLTTPPTMLPWRKFGRMRSSMMSFATASGRSPSSP